MSITNELRWHRNLWQQTALKILKEEELWVARNTTTTFWLIRKTNRAAVGKNKVYLGMWHANRFYQVLNGWVTPETYRNIGVP
jgi:hypothetical protein